MIFLRPLNYNDINRLYEIRSNPLNFNKKYTKFDTSIITKEGVKKWYLNFSNEIDTIRLGICLINKNILIGCITLGKIDYIKKSCEFHIYIDKEYQHKGYGKKSLELLITYIKEIVKLDVIYLEVHKEHIIAIKMYNIFGFKELRNNTNFIVLKKNL